MMEKKEKNATRRPYRKPQIEEVRLAPEEAVLVACKALGVGATKISQCNVNFTCSVAGS